ncbi:MAG TPA: hypothetical protein VF683_07500 [Chthoniobacterales bacterium]|jgi:hypothetical protein
MFLSACLLLLAITAPAQEAAIPPTAGDPKVYGQYPLGYQAIVTRWLETKLADPASAVIDWETEPKAGEYKTQKGERHVGYVVDIRVNARNTFGAYTGKQRYRVVIKNGEVIWGGRPQY